MFDYINVRKYFIEIDGQRYPRDSDLTNYGENDYIDQYRDLKLFYRRICLRRIIKSICILY